MDNKIEENKKEPKVIGIGGIFFKSTNIKESKSWYAENLGMEMSDYGSIFESRNTNNPKETTYLNWNPFDNETTYFKPSKKDFMINYRVQNMEGLVEKLKKNNVVIVDEIETYEYGKFIHIMDNDGNKIELWEPIDSSLSKK